MNTEPKYTTETITPQKAAEILKANPKNRNLRQRSLSRLVKSIKAGQWQLNGDGIRIARDGTLLDGQHRLHAVIEAKKPIRSLIVRNLPPEVKSTIDIGSPRTCADHLKMQGYTGPTFAIAAAAGVCLSFKNGNYSERNEKISPDEMLDYLKANKRLLKSAEIFSSNTEFQKLLPQSVSIACHYLFTEAHRNRGEAFFHHLVSGEGLSKTSPILKLRNVLIAMRGETKRGEISRKIFMWYMTQAFQAYLNDKRVEALPEWMPTSKIVMPKWKRR